MNGKSMKSSKYIRLLTRGRKTGLPHVVELRFIPLGGAYYVIPGNPRSDWVLNALSGNSATVREGDFVFEASAATATPNLASVMRAFEDKYGENFTRRWYGDSHACIRLTPFGPRLRRGEASGELSATTSFADWMNGGNDYYSEVAAAFDSASTEYDFTINRNFINTWIRRRSLKILRGYLHPEDAVVEIGCGTGAETIQVSRWVDRVVAIDISERMLELLRAKASARRAKEKVIPLRLAASDISLAREVFGEKKPRVAYSLNGALNCEPRLRKFAFELHGLLEENGLLVCSVRNNLCLSEALSHLFALQFAKMNPRKRQPVMVSVGGKDIPSYYYSPKSFVETFSPMFSVEKMVALPAFLPPAYLSDHYLRFRELTSGLERAETSLSGKFPFNRFGDQTLVVLRRRQDTDGG
ncbi:MAG: methyltransferase domain-containing protein [Thaumarchaeota archaeon]|nr:methyltransferase domain-containing protein [Nitrososphaerota archaeon]